MWSGRGVRAVFLSVDLDSLCPKGKGFLLGKCTSVYKPACDLVFSGHAPKERGARRDTGPKKGGQDLAGAAGLPQRPLHIRRMCYCTRRTCKAWDAPPSRRCDTGWTVKDLLLGPF